jgi:hypothetical protein
LKIPVPSRACFNSVTHLGISSRDIVTQGR